MTEYFPDITPDVALEDGRPEWVKNPPTDQVVHEIVPICDPEGGVLHTATFNASGERLK